MNKNKEGYTRRISLLDPLARIKLLQERAALKKQFDGMSRQERRKDKTLQDTSDQLSETARGINRRDFTIAGAATLAVSTWYLLRGKLGHGNESSATHSTQDSGNIIPDNSLATAETTENLSGKTYPAPIIAEAPEAQLPHCSISAQKPEYSSADQRDLEGFASMVMRNIVEEDFLHYYSNDKEHVNQVTNTFLGGVLVFLQEHGSEFNMELDPEIARRLKEKLPLNIEELIDQLNYFLIPGGLYVQILKTESYTETGLDKSKAKLGLFPITNRATLVTEDADASYHCPMLTLGEQINESQNKDDGAIAKHDTHSHTVLNRNVDDPARYTSMMAILPDGCGLQTPVDEAQFEQFKRNIINHESIHAYIYDAFPHTGRSDPGPFNHSLKCKHVPEALKLPPIVTNMAVQEVCAFGAQLLQAEGEEAILEHMVFLHLPEKVSHYLLCKPLITLCTLEALPESPSKDAILRILWEKKTLDVAGLQRLLRTTNDDTITHKVGRKLYNIGMSLMREAEHEKTQ